MRYRGGTWSHDNAFFFLNGPLAAASASASDAWLLGATNSAHFSGAAWAEIASPLPVTALSAWAPPDGPTWAVGRAGLVARATGSAWSVETRGALIDPPPSPPLAVTLTAVSPTELYSVGKRVLRRGSSGWSVLPASAIPEDLRFVAAHGAGGRLYLAEESGVMRVFDGTSLTTVGSPLPLPIGGARPAGARSLWASGPTDVWIGTASTGLWHYDGSAWTQPFPDGPCSAQPSGEVSGIAGRSADDIWFVTLAGALGHVTEGGRRCVIAAGRQTATSTGWGSFTGITLTSSDVFVASTQNGVLRFDGDRLANIGQIGASVRAVWAASRSEVWAALSDGDVARFDGTDWVRAGSSEITSVLGTSPTDVWAAGQGGRILRRRP